MLLGYCQNALTLVSSLPKQNRTNVGQKFSNTGKPTGYI